MLKKDQTNIRACNISSSDHEKKKMIKMKEIKFKSETNFYVNENGWIWKNRWLANYVFTKLLTAKVWLTIYVRCPIEFSFVLLMHPQLANYFTKFCATDCNLRNHRKWFFFLSRFQVIWRKWFFFLNKILGY